MASTYGAAARAALLEGHLEESAIPPTQFVVEVVADETWVVAHLEDLFARDLFHAVHDTLVPHVPPGRAGRGPHVQHRRVPQGHLLGCTQGPVLAPGRDGGEAPFFQPAHRVIGPGRRVRIMAPSGV